MADTNPLKKLIADTKAAARPKRLSKSNRTLYMSEPRFSNFAAYVRSKGHNPSEIIDRLIKMYMDEAGEDVPAELRLPESA